MFPGERSRRTPSFPILAYFVVARGLVGTADGVPDAVDRSQLHGAGGPGGFGFRGGVRRGVVRGGPGDAQRAALGWNNVSCCFFLLSVRISKSHENHEMACVRSCLLKV